MMGTVEGGRCWGPGPMEDGRWRGCGNVYRRVFVRLERGFEAGEEATEARCSILDTGYRMLDVGHQERGDVRGMGRESGESDQ